eukprot:PhM_4_TR206/c0_g1_i1/m.95655
MSSHFLGYYRRELLIEGAINSSGNSKDKGGTQQSDDDITAFLRDNSIEIVPSCPMKLPPPARTMQATQLPRFLHPRSTDTPSPLQSVLWPLFCCGTDMVVSTSGQVPPRDIAAPVIYHVVNQPLVEPWHSPIALVLAVTQTRTEFLHAKLCDLAASSRTRVGALMGPMPLGFEKAGYCPDIVVATVGRLRSFEALLKGFNRTTLVVLDEWSVHARAGFDDYLVPFLRTKIRQDAHLVLFDDTLHTQHPVDASRAMVSLRYQKYRAVPKAPPRAPTETDHWSRNPSTVMVLGNVHSEDSAQVEHDVMGDVPQALSVSVGPEDPQVIKVLRVVIMFAPDQMDAATATFRRMHGRQYNGHTITAHFVSHGAYMDGVDGITQEVLSTEPRTLLLRNVVPASVSQINTELRTEIEEECSCFGTILSLRFVLVPKGHWVHEGEAVRIFLQFVSFDAAAEAMSNLNGRIFGGRALSAVLYDEGRMVRNDLQPCSEVEPELPLSSIVLV